MLNGEPGAGAPPCENSLIIELMSATQTFPEASAAIPNGYAVVIPFPVKGEPGAAVPVLLNSLTLGEGKLEFPSFVIQRLPTESMAPA